MNLLLAAGLLLAQVRYPARPPAGEVLLDEAKLLTADDAATIRKTCGELLEAKKIPIVVVTIDSLAGYGAGNWQIQRYAFNLFAEWSIGSASRNYGMLLLVAKGDRKARIELGAGWEHLQDVQAQKVMSEEIVPRFKRGEFSLGILAGVKGLRRIADAEFQMAPAPRPPSTPAPQPVPAPAPAPVLPEPSPVEEPPPYRPVQNNWLPSTSHSSMGGCLAVGLLVVVGIIVIVLVIKMVSGAATSSWGGAPSAGSPGCSAFAGGCLGSGLGNIFTGGSSYGRRGYWDDPWDRPWGSSRRVDHYHHRDSGSSWGSSSSSSSSSSDSSWSSGSSSSDSSSSGGGFSGGGGASGEW